MRVSKFQLFSMQIETLSYNFIRESSLCHMREPLINFSESLKLSDKVIREFSSLRQVPGVSSAEGLLLIISKAISK
mgnify:CR=1 FL=1